jgi:hypothetical protein
MFLECANPKCSSQFDYREGQLIRAPKDLQADRFEAQEFKHFWLCGKCASRYFLEYRQGEGVVMSLRPLHRAEPVPARVAAA